MGYRDSTIEIADYWADPGEWKPDTQSLIDFFTHAGTEAAPSWKEAQRALATRVTGVEVNGAVKHWCGIFACFCLRQAGYSTARWTLYGGKVKNLPLVWGNKGMQPGDIAMITEGNHHFIVTGFTADGRMTTVEGNTSGQMIRRRTRKTTEPYAYYRIPN